MGGKSKSSQATTSTQTSTNIVNDGKFAGAGEVFLDESRVTDSNNTDNSRTREYEDSFNTDKSVTNEGDYAGNTGNITLSDSGAIEAASDIANSALNMNGRVLERAFDFGGDALDEVQTVALSAIDGMNDFGSDAIDSLTSQSSNFADNLSDFGSDAIDSLTSQSSSFADNLSEVMSTSLDANQRVLANVAESNSDDKKLMAELARSTSLAGQDLVAKSSERMTLYMAAALGLGFIAMVVFRGGR